MKIIGSLSKGVNASIFGSDHESGARVMLELASPHHTSCMHFTGDDIARMRNDLRLILAEVDAQFFADEAE